MCQKCRRICYNAGSRNLSCFDFFGISVYVRYSTFGLRNKYTNIRNLRETFEISLFLFFFSFFFCLLCFYVPRALVRLSVHSLGPPRLPPPSVAPSVLLRLAGQLIRSVWPSLRGGVLSGVSPQCICAACCRGMSGRGRGRGRAASAWLLAY